MSSLVVYGSGGHGKVVADSLLAAGEDVAGFIDDTRDAGTQVLGLPILGGREWLAGKASRVALGIGNNEDRAVIVDLCLELGATLVSVIHPRATVSRFARIEDGAVVFAGAVVNPSAVVGRCAIVNTGAVVEHDCVVGPFAHVSPNAVLGGGAAIGEFAHLGIGASMLPRTKVGAHAIVGGGAAVVDDIPARGVARGVPAKATRTR